MSSDAWLLPCLFLKVSCHRSQQDLCLQSFKSKVKQSNIKSVAFTLAVIHLLLPHRIRLLSIFVHEDSEVNKLVAV